MSWKNPIVTGLALAALAGCCDPDVAGMYNDRDDRIVWASNRTGTYQIYIMNGDGSGVEQLSSGGQVNHHPVFTADGKDVVWGRDRTLRRMTLGDPTSERQIVARGDHPWVGRERVFYSKQAAGDSVHSLWMSDLEGGGQERLTAADAERFHASLHPCKELVLFTRASRNADGNLVGDAIGFFDLDSRSHVGLYEPGHPVSAATWEPGGKSFVVAESRGGRYVIVRVTHPDLRATVVAEGPGNRLVPYASYPAGERLIFTLLPEEPRLAREIVTTESDGGDPANVSRNFSQDLQIAGYPAPTTTGRRCVRPPVGCNPIPPPCDLLLPEEAREAAEELGELIGQTDIGGGAPVSPAGLDFASFTRERLQGLLESPDPGEVQQRAGTLLEYLDGEAEPEVAEGIEDVFVNSYVAATASAEAQ